MKVSFRRASAFFVINFLALSPLFAEATQITSTTIFSEVAERPLYIYIPSIKLLSPVQGVGVNEKGNMDVPSGKTNNVGWYQYGVVPGTPGTAVLDAHNTAAFKNLKDVRSNEDIYIYTSSGRWQRFTINKTRVYDVKKMHPKMLFAPSSSPDINLITCAGTLLGNGEATHRLIVSARLST